MKGKTIIIIIVIMIIIMMSRYYADTDADCQSFHICAPDGSNSLLKYSFLCPNGTLFNQQYFICDWWFNVDCSQVQTSLFIFNNFFSHA